MNWGGPSVAVAAQVALEELHRCGGSCEIGSLRKAVLKRLSPGGSGAGHTVTFSQAMTSLIEDGKVMRVPSPRGWAFDTYRLTRADEQFGDVG